MADPVSIGVAAKFVVGSLANLVLSSGSTRKQLKREQAAVESGRYVKRSYGGRITGFVDTRTGASVSRREVRQFGARILAGGSPADVLPALPQTSTAGWYAAVPIFARMGQPSIPRPDLRKQMWERDREAAIKKYLKQSKLKIKAKRLAKRAVANVRKVAPKLAAPILKRIPKGAGPIVAAQVAYTVGYEIGTQIYRQWERYAYGPARPARPAPGTPGVQAPHPPRRAPISSPPASRAPTPARPRAPAVGNRPAQAARPTPGAAPTVAPAVGTVAAPAPAPAPALPRSRWTLPKLMQAAGTVASVYSLVAPKPATKPQPKPKPLTRGQSPPLGYTPTRTDECKCPKPRKRKARSECRNPIVRKRKTRRGSVTYLTTTRKLQCQPSSSAKPR